jgi:RNA polymerase sigma-70 factor, ECF subfamily
VDHSSELSDEAESIRKARQGSAADWEALVQAHQQPVFRYAYLLSGDADEAEDIAQEAFIRAYHALGRFDETRPLRPWLLRITANLAHNRRRSAARYLAALQRLVRREPATGMRIEEKTEQNLQNTSLRHAVDGLPADDRQIIYLRYFLDLTVEETAAAEGIAPGTVKSRLHRALNRLRHRIQQNFPELSEIGPG